MAAPATFLEIAIENDDEDAVQYAMLFDINQNRTSSSTYDPNIPRFDLNNLTDEQIRSQFRFGREEIYRLLGCLLIPDHFVCKNRSIVHGVDALCILLRRLVYPNRLLDLEKMFVRPKSTLSLIINQTLDYVYDTNAHLLNSIDQPWLSNEHVTKYADAIFHKGAPLENIFGFIDGTVRAVCRPTHNQKVCFNGHKRVHALKFQSMVLPNGLIANMFGPVEGRRHDCALLRLSGLLEQLDVKDLRSTNNQPFAIYGDPAYPMRHNLICPFKGANLSQEEQSFNFQMSQVRECVEWEFGKILNLFAFLDFKKNLKLMLQPVAKLYLIGAFFANCHTCLYGSQTSSFFDLQPPSLEEYLGQV